MRGVYNEKESAREDSETPPLMAEDFSFHVRF